MLRLLCVCGNGMGTSTILKIKLKGICDRLGVNAQVESCSAGEALAFASNTDIILTTPEWGNMIKYPEEVVLITAVNLMDEKLIEEKLSEAFKTHFADKY